MKKGLFVLILLLVTATFVYTIQPKIKSTTTTFSVKKTNRFINKDSLTLKSRVNVPLGYTRVTYANQSFKTYLRNYILKPFGSKIVNYDNSEYYWQGGHIGVLDIAVPKNGLQQCADALIRIRSEYLWDNNRKDEIGFNFTSGHYCDWLKYAQGYRPKIKGNKVTFHKTAVADSSKANFYKYLNLIYMYSGTLSLYNELKSVAAKDLQIGDMLIRGGSPGHIVMLGDEAINAKGEKLFLLFQGNTPAQSVHLVKNLEDTSLSPWYALKDGATIPVSNYTFSSAKFVRFK